MATIKEAPALTRLIRLVEVKRLVGLSRATIYGLIRQGLFPRPVKLTHYASAWSEAEVHRWIDERLAQREAA